MHSTSSSFSSQQLNLCMASPLAALKSWQQLSLTSLISCNQLSSVVDRWLMLFVLQLCVTQLRFPNSGPILRTNSDPTLRLISESPICTTLYHPISNPWIPPLLLVMSSLSYFLFKHCFTLPYLLFPAFPSAMPVCSILLIPEFPESLSEPIGLSLNVHNTFQTWKVLCSLFVQTLNYISRTNSCMLP